MCFQKTHGIIMYIIMILGQSTTWCTAFFFLLARIYIGIYKQLKLNIKKTRATQKMTTKLKKK